MRKENKASNMHTKLIFSIMKKRPICLNHLCKGKWNFIKHKQDKIINLFLYVLENERHKIFKAKLIQKEAIGFFSKIKFLENNHFTKIQK